MIKFFYRLTLCFLLFSSNLLISHEFICHYGEADWNTYYENTRNIDTPRLTLNKALNFFKNEEKKSGYAVDLGAGTGRDTLFLLNNDWNVLAIDAEQRAIEIILEKVHPDLLTHLNVQVVPFDEMHLPDNVDLINASYSLPFCPPDQFSQCWNNIEEHITVGGRFSGHFFGDRDDWAADPELTHHTKDEVLNLFKDHFEIEYFKVDEDNGKTSAGTTKHWHVFHIVAKKISA